MLLLLVLMFTVKIFYLSEDIIENSIKKGIFMSIEQLVHYQAKLSFELDSADLYTAIINQENIIIIDGRSPQAYQKEHIPGAVNLWHKDMSFHTTEHLDKNKIYICYCDGIGCNASTKAALKLLTL